MPSLSTSHIAGQTITAADINAIAAAVNALNAATPVGTLLGVSSYDPGTATVFSTSTTAFSDVDATHSAVTFTVPTSGNVLVRISTVAKTDTGGDFFTGLREGTSDVGLSFIANSQTLYFPTTSAGLVTGLTPGASKTWKTAFRVSSGATGRLLVGGDYSPLTVEVWAAP